MLDLRSKIYSFLFSILLLIALSSESYSKSYQDDFPSVTVLASDSLSQVMTELARIYSRSGELTISATYNSPHELVKLIEEGETADIYISENPLDVQDLINKGLVEIPSVTSVAENKMVLVASKASILLKKYSKNTPLDKVLKNLGKESLIHIGNPDTCPSGILSQRVFEKLGYWERIKPSIVREDNNSLALYMISSTESAGVVYYTDAISNDDIEIISQFPENLHDKIIYKMAVVTGENMVRAREFLKFLKSDEAKSVFKKYGFIVDGLDT